MEDVIFSGTRDRNPTGMAEVCLTIDPEIYGGPDTNAPTEIEIQDDLPRRENLDENWDEAESAPRPPPKRNGPSRKHNPERQKRSKASAPSSG